MAYEPRMSRGTRRRLAGYRKAILTTTGRVYRDLSRRARVSYSMAEKWVNCRRTSRRCERAFQDLTGHPAYPQARPGRSAA